MRQLIMLLAALVFGGCASAPAHVNPWSEPVVRGTTGMPAPADDAVSNYLCWRPTRAYPVMMKNTCI